MSGCVFPFIRGAGKILSLLRPDRRIRLACICRAYEWSDGSVSRAGSHHCRDPSVQDLCRKGALSGDYFFNIRYISPGAWGRSILDRLLYRDE